MSCQPPYDYRPSYTPRTTARALVRPEHRSRLFAGGTYFRSLEQGQDQNLISLEITATFGPDEYTLFVRYDGTLVETFGPVDQTVDGMSGTCPIENGINNLRTLVNAGSEYIEMFTRGADIVYDFMGFDSPCLSAFSETFMSGGDGRPRDARDIARINSGPERTLVIITSTEDITGTEIDPPAERKVWQWNGEEWITYSNLEQGKCPATTFVGAAFIDRRSRTA